MNALVKLLNSFDTLYFHMQTTAGTLIRALLILEIIWFGFSLIQGKVEKATDVVWKFFTLVCVLFTCTYLRQISGMFLNEATDFFEKVAALGGSTTNFNFSNPLKSGAETVVAFLNMGWDACMSLFDETLDLRTKEFPKNFSEDNPNVTKIKIVGIPEILVPSFLAILLMVLLLIATLGFVALLLYMFVVYFVALLEYNLVILLGTFFMLFTLWQPTKFMGEKVMSNIFANIVKIITLHLVMIFTFLIVQEGVINKFGNGAFYNSKTGVIMSSAVFLFLIEIVIIGIVAYMLITKAPAIANGFLMGTTSMNAMSFGKIASMAIGAAVTGAVGAKALSGAMGKGAGQAAGGLGSAIGQISSASKMGGAKEGLKQAGKQVLKGGLSAAGGAAQAAGAGIKKIGSATGINPILSSAKIGWDLGKAKTGGFGGGEEKYGKTLREKDGKLNEKGKGMTNAQVGGKVQKMGSWK